MIKIYPTQSSIDVVVSGVAEKISDVKNSVWVIRRHVNDYVITQ